jgi:hypothetical protein
MSNKIEDLCPYKSESLLWRYWMRGFNNPDENYPEGADGYYQVIQGQAARKRIK